MDPPKVDFATGIWRVKVAKFVSILIWILSVFFDVFLIEQHWYLDCESTPSGTWSQDSRLIYGGRCTKIVLQLLQLFAFFKIFLENASGELLATRL